MGIHLVGDKDRFAIEYELLPMERPFGHVRLWVAGQWFGDIERDMFLHHMAKTLKWMVLRKPFRDDVVYAAEADAPSDAVLLAKCGWSWGDVFDDFSFALYAAEAERQVHVLWALSENRVDVFPDYPRGPHHARIPYAVFDDVVRRFLWAARFRDLLADEPEQPGTR